LIAAGAMRHSIELQSYTSTPDGMGGSVDVYATEETVWAEFMSQSAIEKARAAAPTMTITHVLQIRYLPGVKGSWRIKYGTRFFSLVSVVNPKERNVALQLVCNEVLT